MRVAFILMLLACAVPVQPALSDELDDLNAQVQELRQEVKDLQKQSKSKTTEDSPSQKDSRSVSNMNHDFDTTLGVIELPKLNIRGFGDAGWNFSKTGQTKTDSFFIGQIDFLITSKLTEHASTLVEFYFNNPPDNTSPINLPRALIQYSVSNELNLRLGLMHTMIGYWNHAYHHGNYLQTSYSRPEIWRYDRIYLPIHTMGVQLFGVKNLEKIDVDYTLGVYNGRGPTGGNQREVDNNDPKAVGLVFGFTPHGFIPGLTVGGTIYGDKIPANPTATPPTVARSLPMTERILGSHVVYRLNKLQVIGELFHIYHDDMSSQRTYKTSAYYVQTEYALNQFTPYARFDYINFGNGDPLYAPNVIDVNRYTVGTRWDFMSWNALKLEYSYSDNKDTLDNQLIVINVSFTF